MGHIEGEGSEESPVFVFYIDKISPIKAKWRYE